MCIRDRPEYEQYQIGSNDVSGQLENYNRLFANENLLGRFYEHSKTGRPDDLSSQEQHNHLQYIENCVDEIPLPAFARIYRNKLILTQYHITEQKA